MTTVQRITESDVLELAAQFDVAVDDREAARLRDLVDGFLDDLEPVEEMPLHTDVPDAVERSWWEPTAAEDPHNALITWCRIPPTEDASNLLGDVTVGLKDSIPVASVPMTCASEVMRGYVPSTDATVVRRLREAGATIRAKTNLDEFGSVGQGTNGAGGPISNPHDADRTAGGSSGGSAVAVATEAVDVAIGGDTGGSVRIPAAYCGIVGLKPTYGLVPTKGCVENTYPMDHLGPMARTVREAARTLEATAGREVTDPASMEAAGRPEYEAGGYVSALDDPTPIADVTVGTLDEGFTGCTTPEVESEIRGVVDELAAEGASVQSVSLDGFEYARAIKNTLTYSDHAAHWRAAAAPYRRGGVVDPSYQAALARRSEATSRSLNVQLKARILAGAALVEMMHGHHYTKALAGKEVLRSNVDQLMSEVDVLATPTTPTVAPRIENAPPSFDYARNARIANVTGHPAITLPVGSIEGLPVGLQLIGSAFDEAKLLEVATRIEDRC